MPVTDLVNDYTHAANWIGMAEHPNCPNSVTLKWRATSWMSYETIFTVVRIPKLIKRARAFGSSINPGFQ